MPGLLPRLISHRVHYQTLRSSFRVYSRYRCFLGQSEWGLFFGGAPDIFKQLGFPRNFKFAGSEGWFLKELLKSARLKVSKGLRAAKNGSR